MNDIEKMMIHIKIEGTRVVQKPDELTIIGRGRSAVVFKLPSEPKVLKVFYPEFVHLSRVEASIYQELSNNEDYPIFYEEGEGYVVLEYLEGLTFYECLIQGIVITKEMIENVDQALNYARKNGLNPSDTHLQNIMLLSNGEVRVIDVVRFRQSKICTHWEDLKVAYDSLYSSRFFPKKYPVWFMEMIIWLYRKGFIRLKKRK
ncbi:serine/threonine protein kinase [Bacillus sp. RAR_GA_16]|uniref:serine/threonine protein kinase n=1 Tax=Bacillus sp. RAR_GA_16 TaxID=2876774 RepID=UPI001CC920AE|nr:serine/threonine protein kinase [Bacillus sp. RAR_GA_16]MCA0172495.1 serine/threonine protein kinase [Bacillus sp. RAR_GA_16]